MTSAFLVLLVGLSGYLGMRLHAALGENAALRTNVEQLKRRLNQRPL